MKNRINIIMAAICTLTFILGCEKNFLDEPQSKSLLVPTSLENFQALLDNTALMNKSPGLQLLGGDELAPADNGYAAYKPEEKNSYLWAKDVFEGKASSDWTNPYQIILVANIVLEGMENAKQLTAQANDVRGQAHFYRAMGSFYLCQKFAKPFSPTASTDLGIPLNLTADVNLRPGRGNVLGIYNQMLEDFSIASSMLPTKVISTNRPNKAAAFAMLSRIYLLMSDYSNSLDFANKSIADANGLYDFNMTPYLTPKGNVEVLFNSGMYSYTFLNSTLNFVNQELYSSYSADDLRKTYYFLARTGGRFTGRGIIYSSNIGLFSGVALDEMYLNKAECLARSNKYLEGIEVLNQLLITRWKRGTFVPFVASNTTEALAIILQERKKELLMRGLRWGDLRRINQQSQYALTLKKTIAGVDYNLLPNSSRYVFPIPDAEINLSGIAQNER